MKQERIGLDKAAPIRGIVLQTNKYNYNNKHTLCWDCKNATGNCSWSQELIPVKGWTAEPSEKEYGSFTVQFCPEFIRDSIGGGIKRYKQK